ncbi:helix-turn-helix domain-containing protein [Latilactobacillus curvatus]|uniref:helix-turn-helix domain-containing protein n=1 Tax=Latilactobacillus curvatus TaxID=28038 RepID=UPI000B5DC8F3|nr:helix-turn-helix transcriptional regulator [Latilactobacillus curvatus]ASN62132.1 transcriptional regulator [Latilactobacillus curvatus]MCM6843836.1 helix-turn-helix domain-containing protein [Latilactobacillus curvatus]MCM6861277.1 helix-turn-helix domain-containing protein [Latilactobacillus curvatus]MCM6868575.1 helix-turn-helix domain-containing protein [Latilactobacillus curvatus]MCT2879547.1 XRE family transcriptional regulator [Latilactobacillus curvatus]
MTTLERIKEISKKRGYSLTKVNEMANLGTNTIYSWKTKEPSFNNLKAVADVLGVSTDYLLGKTDNPSVSNKPKEVDIEDENVIMTYEGKPIPPEDLEIMKRFLNGGMGHDGK